MTKKKSISAADLVAKLNTDPDYVAKRARDEERLKRAADWKRAEAPLVQELLESGLVVESVWDLVNTAAPYVAVLPILLDHLQRAYPAAVREGIARALAVPEAKFGWHVLMRMYREEHEDRAKDGLAVALAGASDDEVIGDVIALARDTGNGRSRLLLLSALERSNDPRARAALMELGTDPELKKEIQVILGRQKHRAGSSRRS